MHPLATAKTAKTAKTVAWSGLEWLGMSHFILVQVLSTK